LITSITWLGLAWLARDIPPDYLHNLFEIFEKQYFCHRGTESAEKDVKTNTCLVLSLQENHYNLIGLQGVRYF